MNGHQMTRYVLFIAVQMVRFSSAKVNLEIINDCQYQELINVSKDITDEYFRTDLNFLVVNLVGQYEHEIVSAFVSHVHKDSPVPVVTLNNVTCGSNLQHYIDDCDAEEEDGRSYEEIDPSIWLKLGRADTIENSVAFITFTNDVTSHCFVNPRWEGFPLWNPRGLFLLVITTPVQRGPQEFVDLFEDCWDSYNILNLVVLYSEGNMSCRQMSNQNILSNLHILTYNPFIDQHFPKDVFKKWDINAKLNLFKDKTIDLYGYKIEAVTSPYDELVIFNTDVDGKINFGGPNGMTFSTVIEKFNTSVKSINIDYEMNYFANNNLSSKSFFVPDGILLPQMLRKMVNPHVLECYTLIVPKAPKIPHYMSIILPFTRSTWIVCFITYVTISFVWSLTIYFDILEDVCNDPIGDSIFESVRLLMWGHTYLKFDFFIQRFFIISCTLFNIIICNLYQSSLVGHLTLIKFYPDINTFQEFLYSDMKIAIHLSSDRIPNMFSEFELDSSTMQLFSKLQFMKNKKETIIMTATHRNICAMSNQFSALHVISKPQYYKDGYPLLHIIDDCFIKFIQTFSVTTSTNPFLLRLGAIISRILESGLMSKWRNDYARESKLLSNKLNLAVHIEPIAFQHLIVPFTFLVCGLGFSLTAFLCEIFSPIITGKLSTHTN